MPFSAVDLTQIKTYPLVRRENRVALDDLIFPHTPIPAFDSPELAEIATRIVAARQANHPVIMFFGGHIIKRGLAPLVIRLLKKGVITHLASNGAATIHDFEIGFQGNTSEDVAKSLEDGSFGMAEETGAWMNAAIRRGATEGLGLGESLGRLIAEDPRFAYKEDSVLYSAYALGIPYTVHVALGTDIIHQHPAVDFAAIGATSGQDFKIFSRSVCDLEGGVFLNFGSAVLGPEVFLKALSIARNLGNPLRVFTTANFDIIPLAGDYRKNVDDHNPEYYYRPRKNIVNRPVLLGGRGFHIVGDHLQTLPNLYAMVVKELPERAAVSQNSAINPSAAVSADFAITNPAAAAILEDTLAAAPELAHLRDEMIRTYTAIRQSMLTGGTLFLSGNGGSMSDALHISGELDKAYKKQRRIPQTQQDRLQSLPFGAELAQSLQVGLRSVVLGINPALASAVDNDFATPHMGVAQELFALARTGDVFLGISTSGNAKNLQYATSVAHLRGLTSIIFTGEPGGALAQQGDIVLKAPAHDTPIVQTWHIRMYHCLCEMLEAQAFAHEEAV